jgi:hypothetical protein
MGHYMTKEGTSIRCVNCLYWSSKAMATGTCGHANQQLGKLTSAMRTCSDFWPKSQYRL